MSQRWKLLENNSKPTWLYKHSLGPPHRSTLEEEGHTTGNEQQTNKSPVGSSTLWSHTDAHSKQIIFCSFNYHDFWSINDRKLSARLSLPHALNCCMPGEAMLSENLQGRVEGQVDSTCFTSRGGLLWTKSGGTRVLRKNLNKGVPTTLQQGGFHDYKSHPLKHHHASRFMFN